MRRRKLGLSRRGDTLIEVMLSISIFALVAMITINMMNDGINTAQRTLEAEMARNEIDAQAEALRFIHNNYVAERQKLESDSQFRAIWNKITDRAARPSVTKKDISDNAGSNKSFDINEMNSCSEPYETNGHLDFYKAFVLNTRLIMPELSANNSFSYLGYSYKNLIEHTVVYKDSGSSKDKKTFAEPSLYPRIIYKKLNSNDPEIEKKRDHLDEGGEIFNEIESAEGIWIDAVSNIDSYGKSGADYYDFYIRTCWQAAGQHVPSTLTTVVRLYNPEVME